MERSKHIFILMVISCLLFGCQSSQHINSPAVLAVVIITLIITLFIILAMYSNILRDEVSDCDEFAENARKLQQKQKSKFVNKELPFSLTKIQFGLWTVIIASCYIYLSLCKGDCSEGPINKTALVLMGIFASTAVASKIIDKKEISDNRPRHQNTPSQGLFIDILSDDNGISLHRFQNFVWTLIAMTIYIYKVSSIRAGCVLPELSDTLLTLTGISSATYLVMRTQENNPSIKEAQEKASTTANDSSKITLSDGVSEADNAPKQLI